MNDNSRVDTPKRSPYTFVSREHVSTTEPRVTRCDYIFNLLIIRLKDRGSCAIAGNLAKVKVLYEVAV
jgi:hypothetical protein